MLYLCSLIRSYFFLHIGLSSARAPIEKSVPRGRNITEVPSTNEIGRRVKSLLNRRAKNRPAHRGIRISSTRKRRVRLDRADRPR